MLYDMSWLTEALHKATVLGKRPKMLLQYRNYNCITRKHLDVFLIWCFNLVPVVGDVVLKKFPLNHQQTHRHQR